MVLRAINEWFSRAKALNHVRAALGGRPGSSTLPTPFRSFATQGDPARDRKQLDEAPILNINDRGDGHQVRCVKTLRKSEILAQAVLEQYLGSRKGGR
jgi:hypothetical protein